MSQYATRLHIKVTSPRIWSRFKGEDDAGFGLAECALTNETSYIIDQEWGCTEDEIKGIVNTLAKTLGNEGIIIADTTNINVDPYNYCVFYLGDHVRVANFNIYFGRDKCAMHFEQGISDIAGWLSYGKFKVSEVEREVAFRCGIAAANGHFEGFSTDLQFPEKIYLRETSFEGRTDNIEKVSLDEEVYFVPAGDSYDATRLEVTCDMGSLGYLPSDVSDKLAPILANNALKYKSKITELVKLSKRNKNARSSIIAISIQAEIVYNQVKIPCMQ